KKPGPGREKADKIHVDHFLDKVLKNMDDDPNPNTGHNYNVKEGKSKSESESNSFLPNSRP
ncbi:7658_t:CDS:2, partial [Gigaspora margarita]